MAALALAGMALLAGCSKPRPGQPPETEPFSGADVQRTIDSELPRTFSGLRVGAARCPGQLDPTQDKTGTCTLTVEGVPVRIRVDRVDADRFKVGTDQAVVPVAKLEASMQPAVSRKGGQTYSVDCGDEAVKVFDPPGTLTCVATPARGAPVTLVVTVADKQGNYTFEAEKDS
ncbi:MAG TPA: DUF4333 domain-containing protein [Mycobacteriales bacterium]